MKHRMDVVSHCGKEIDSKKNFRNIKKREAIELGTP